MSGTPKNKALREILREKIKDKFAERGMKCEEVDLSSEQEKENTPDLIIKSGGIEVGKIYILLSEVSDEFFRSIRGEKEQVYVAVERGKEKSFSSFLLKHGLAGKVKFILWEFKIHL